jgi:hypothetical protein
MMRAYYFAYVLSLLRLPFALIPYLLKLSLFLYLKKFFSNVWNKYPIQVIRIVGDFVNFFLAMTIFWEFQKTFDWLPIKIVLVLSIIAEAVRLITEKGIMILSAFWQSLPHRSIAKSLQGKLCFHHLKTYYGYYILSDQERLAKALRKLRVLARLSKNKQTISKLKYVNAFKIVPDSMDLRAGEVRNIARGEVYVHARWTNDPQLLYGLALRRSPWIFAPRFLRRPFYYRTEANRLMTAFVFENFRLCPLFAIYQFGHEVKSARYDAFYRFTRWLGYQLEEYVYADGTYKFDPFAKWILRNELKSNANRPRPLWTDDEVLHDMDSCPIPSAFEIAEMYTYPLKYVQEVLLPKLRAYRNIS